MNKQEKFFYDHAGFSYRPEGQTREEGHRERAKRLAQAEMWALDNLSFYWEVDQDSSSIVTKRWLCLAYDNEGKVVASLGSINLECNGTPWSDPYRRVVEAELALEEMPK